MEQLVLSAALHDIGKMIVPLTVMNKASRLDGKLELIRQRFQLLDALFERDFWKGRITREELEAQRQTLNESLALIEEKNRAGFLPDPVIEALQAIGARAFEYEDGSRLPYLTPEELHCITVRKGTLTQEERAIMESHALMTRRILSKVRFSKRLSQVPFFAASHHEYLNGSGYPDRLRAEDLPLESRILTVVDVFDTLTSTDRPYKAPIPRPRAFAILRGMVKDGQIDGTLVDWLEAALFDLDQADIDAMALRGLLA